MPTSGPLFPSLIFFLSEAEKRAMAPPPPPAPLPSLKPIFASAQTLASPSSSPLRRRHHHPRFSPVLSLLLPLLFSPKITIGAPRRPSPAPVPSKPIGGAPEVRDDLSILSTAGIEPGALVAVALVLVSTMAGGPPPPNSGDNNFPEHERLLRRPPTVSPDSIPAVHISFSGRSRRIGP